MPACFSVSPPHLTLRDRTGCLLEGYIQAEGNLMTEALCEVIFEWLDHGIEWGKRVQKAICQTLNLDPLTKGDTFHLSSYKQSGEAPDLFDHAPIMYTVHICVSDTVASGHRQLKLKVGLSICQMCLKSS